MQLFLLPHLLQRNHGGRFNMLIIREKTLRRVLREEFERFMETPQETSSYTIKAPTGAEIIMPNFVKERFDEGRVESIKDIIE